VKSIVVGTAGHIDHGKTALVKALTGIDADRLQEEKRRGITIDLGFANACSYPQDMWLLMGTSGGLSGTHAALHWRYVDPLLLPPRPVSAERTPGRRSNRDRRCARRPPP